uniref:leukocyte immunoglobulin-like receptor subfamily B member 4 n=1 Tax=Arvicanthis niloticus TaxID=61156 RepID=UPI0014863795|nr:leukocyte immunoglobulin-like receptor subfamily B member 4 [Arvicanthis niloticus]
MIPILGVLLYLGLTEEQRTAVLAGPLTKPIIWAEPGSVIAKNTSVNIWCQGSWEAKEYLLYKEGSVDPWDRKIPMETRNKTMFYIEHMETIYTGLYKCYYNSSAGLSDYSSTLELTITGAYKKPSLSVWPHFAVTSGEHIIMQCSSLLGFGRFILIQEGKSDLSWTMDSQKYVNQSFQSLFLLGSVTPKHNGTFRCYGYFKNLPQVWSKSSDPLDLLVSESKNKVPNLTENEAPALQHQTHTVEDLTRMAMAALVLVILVIVLLEAWFSKRVEQDATRK